MKLLTLNCHSWQEDNQLEKIRIIAEDIKNKSYDVISLEEVSQLKDEKPINNKTKANNFALVLLDELKKIGVTDYNMVWDFSHIGYDIYEEGLAILTKHEIVKEHSFFISRNHDRSYWKTRKIVGATVKINEKLMNFYACHLGWWTDEEEPFKDQVDRLFNNIDFTNPTFLMGDFNNNASIKGEGYDYLIEKGMYDTFTLAEKKDKGITVKGEIDGWDSNKNDMRLDLILTNKKIPIKSSKTIFNGENNPVVSDHYGVEVETK